jgi:tRNA(Ile)-lysidine synthase
MGSSPVTATTSPLARLLDAAEALWRSGLLTPRDTTLVVAFSGGPDSTALLLSLLPPARARGVRLVAAHLDHALDAGSRGRAEAAARLVRRLGADWRCERRDVPDLRQRGESLEAAARRVRYGFLERIQQEVGSRWILLAHQRDDLAETVLLRLLFGSGLAGLAAIQPVRENRLRPLLGLRRREIEDAVAAAGLEPIQDPTNQEPHAARNRVRLSLLPRLRLADPDLDEILARLAERVQRVNHRLDQLFERALAPSRTLLGGLALERSRFLALPAEVRRLALPYLHRRAGANYPASAAAALELDRQLTSDRRIRCDCGRGWRWIGRRQLLELQPPTPICPRFSYTLQGSGEIYIRELSLTLRLAPSRSLEPGSAGADDRAAFALPLSATEPWVVRNRRPGDRFVPPGRHHARRLKEVLIDLGVPREQRDRLPILCWGGNLLWVACVGVDERFRPRPETAAETWTVSLHEDSTPAETSEAQHGAEGLRKESHR